MGSIENYMIKNCNYCFLGDSIQKVSLLIKNNDCSEVVVIDNMTDKHPIGVISEHDIVSKCATIGIKSLDLNAKDLMQKVQLIIPVNMEIEDCLRILEQNQLKKGIVVDEMGAYSGEILLSELARLFED